MTTTAFQWVFDKAASVSVERKHLVGQSITRNGVVRSVDRGAMPLTFTVKLPDGMKWSETRTQIKALDDADRFTTGDVAFSNAGYASWLGNTTEFTGVTWNVICVKMPSWTIFSRDQVSWDGPFVFSVVVA
jgi:hypothetical protein